MAVMLPIIADNNFNRLAMIDDYISFIWTYRYYKCGDFELCLSVTSRNIEIIKRNYYVMREDDDNVGIIEKIQIQRDEDMNEVMIITGRFLSGILARRIVADQIQVSGTIPACVQSLLNANAINPTMTVRQIPNLTFNSLIASPPTMQAQYTGKPLMETIENICEAHGLGFKTVLDSSNNFVVTMYEGIDRSVNQTAVPQVIFSDEYDNLLSSEYIEDNTTLITDVLVAGEGEGIDRKKIWAAVNSQSGLSRYELFDDARNASTNDGEISDNVYYQQLTEDGLESISEITKAFSGTVYFDNIVFKQDVYIGDICSIINDRWGIGINSRLIEVIESTSEDGVYSVIPTFGI